MSAKTVGEALTELLADQISEERALKSSLAQRSSTAIAAAGAIVPLSLGAITLASRAQAFTLPRLALALTALAIILLVCAALLALVVISPWTQTIVNVDQLFSQVSPSSWGEDGTELQIANFKHQLGLAAELRRGNRTRSRYLTAVLSFEILGLIAVSGGVGVILRAGGL